MRLAVVTPPAPIVTVEEARKHLRLDHRDDDDFIAALVATATAWIDGPDGWLGRALGSQTLELRRDGWSDHLGCGSGYARIPLPCPPLITVDTVAYVDPVGVVRTVPTLDWYGAGGWLSPSWGRTWPAARDEAEAVRITYRAGYPDGVPPPIKHAILLMVGTLYANRESSAEDLFTGTVKALLSPFRVYG